MILILIGFNCIATAMSMKLHFSAGATSYWWHDNSVSNPQASFVGEPLPGIELGAGTLFEHLDFVSFGLSLRYISKALRNAILQADDDAIRSQFVNIRYRSFDIPGVVYFFTPFWQTKPYFKAGLYGMRTVSIKLTRPRYESSSEIIMNSDFQKWELGSLAAIGVRWPAAHGDLALEFEYGRSFTRVNDSYGKNLRSVAMMLMLTYVPAWNLEGTGR
ncbi:MAG: hypothetical protein GF398_16460 [Chitinivibrionales bacterium]|nr:hypothetical protein [Chitinivibrionales bacterium]